MSLTSWFRDYVYIPLGGSRCSRIKQLRNIFIVFALSGLWHGAAWTFVTWGLLHACFFVPLLFCRREENVSAVRACVGCIVTMLAVMLAWVFFRAATISVAIEYYEVMFSRSLFSWPLQFRSMLPLAVACIVFEWFRRREDYALSIARWPMIIRWCMYIGMSVACVAFNQRTGEFIYFQF